MFYNKKIVTIGVTTAVLLSSLTTVAFAKNKKLPVPLAPMYNHTLISSIPFFNVKQKAPVQCVRKIKDPIKLKTSTDPQVLSLSTDLDGDGNEEVIVNAPQGSLALYSNTDPDNFGMMAFPVGDQPIYLPIAYFTTGKYTVIATTEPNACQTLSKAQCKKDSNYIASATFTVKEAAETTLPVCKKHKEAGE